MQHQGFCGPRMSSSTVRIWIVVYEVLPGSFCHTPEDLTAQTDIDDVTRGIQYEQHRITPTSKQRYLIKLRNEIYCNRPVMLHWDLCTVAELKRCKRHRTESSSDVSGFFAQELVESKPPSYSYRLRTFVAVRASDDSECTAYMCWIDEGVDV